MLTALDRAVWVKIYDSAGQQLMQKEMGLGESYTLPETASGPMIATARPDALQISVGGKPVAKLANGSTAIKDVPISAAALLARPAVQTAPAGRATSGAASPLAPALAPAPAPARRPADRSTATGRAPASTQPVSTQPASRPVAAALPAASSVLPAAEPVTTATLAPRSSTVSQ